MKGIKYICARPFKAYFSMGSIAFGTVFAGNTIAGLVNNDPPISIYKYPQIFSIVNFTKSMYFGCFWPSIPLMLLNKDGMSDLFILGNNADEIFSNIDKITLKKT